MSKLLNVSGGTIGLEQFKEIRERTMKKWGELGFLDGLTGDTTNNILPIAIKVYAKTIENPDNK